MKNDYVRNSLVTIITVVVVLICFEYGVRLFNNQSLDSLFPISTAGWGAWFNEENVRVSKTLGYEIVPNTRHYNSFGIPDSEHAIEKGFGVKRIVCVGDSVTARSRFPQFLDEQLNVSGDTTYEVWNAGIIGYSLTQEARYIEEKIIGVQPDLIVLGFCWNDFDTTPIVTLIDNRLVGLFPDEELLFLNPFLLKHSALYRLCVYARFSLLKEAKHDKRKVIYDTQRALAKTIDILATHHIPIVIVLLPMPKSYEDNMEWYAFDEMIQVADTLNIPYVDLRDTVVGCVPLSMRIDAHDSSHINSGMGAVIAQRLEPYIKETMHALDEVRVSDS